MIFIMKIIIPTSFFVLYIQQREKQTENQDTIH